MNDLVKKFIEPLIDKKYINLFNETEIKTYLEKKFDYHQNSLKTIFNDKVSPYKDYSNLIKIFEKDDKNIKSKEYYLKAWESLFPKYQKFIKENNIIDDTNFFNKEFNKFVNSKNIDFESTYQTLLKNWKENIYSLSQNWKEKILKNEENNFLNEITQWINSIQKIFSEIEKLGINIKSILDILKGDLSLLALKKILKLLFNLSKNFKVIKNETDIISDSINRLYGDFLNSNISIKDYFNNMLKNYGATLKNKLINKISPYNKYDEIIQKYKNIKFNKETSIESFKSLINEYENFTRETSTLDIDSINFFKKELKKYEDTNQVNDLNTSYELLLKRWEEKNDTLYKKWEFDIINQEREKFLKEKLEWLKNIQQLSKEMNKLGIKSEYLLDFSEGNLSIQDTKNIKKYLEYFSKDEGIKKLCNLLGRMHSSLYVKKTEKKIEDIKVNVEKYYLEHSSKGEIIGLNIGKEIENILPHELSFFVDSDLSDLFELKYLENQLSIFDMASMQKQTETIIEQREKEYEKKEKENKGPMIICVDTSASMSGFPEEIAKAITLFLSLEARKEKRSCYVINFSTRIETINLSKSYSIGNLINFLKQSFHGGTDATPAILHSIKTMQQEEYKKADMLIISDFVMNDLSSNTLSEIEKMRKQKNKFYSLSIGNFQDANKVTSIFDKEWFYDPDIQGIEELTKMKKDIF